MAALNPEQDAAVRNIDAPLLVLAGAGSGKTRVITRKIAYLIRECGFAAGKIAAVTFTNKAAREMQERVAKEVSGVQAEGLTVCTFHSLGLRFLQQEHAAAGLKSGFSIFDAQDSRDLLRKLSSADPDRLKSMQWSISALKNSLVSPEQAIDLSASEGETATARLYADYQRHLRAYNAVDFDDLLMLPVQLMNDHAGVRERWQNRFHYLLVDEYQDSNGAQYEILKLLAGPQGRFTVVGDDDQSIYAWRGARPENLKLLKQDYPMLQVVKLEQNYRSCTHILQAANQLISSNPREYEKSLWSALGPGEILKILPADDGEQEAEQIALSVQTRRMRNPQGSCAILYRSNHQSRAFEQALRERGLSYTVSGGQSFFERGEVRDLLAYLRLLANPDDDAAFLRVVNTPRREIGASTLEKLGLYAQQRHIGMYQAAGEARLAGVISERALPALARFHGWIEGLGRMAESASASAVLRQLIDDCDYLDWIRRGEKNVVVADRRIANVEELLSWISRLGESRDLAGVVAHLGLIDRLDGQDKEEAKDVQLMTLHAAKGLEFDHVWLPGLEEGQLPHHNSIESDTVEEERRLMYVGITRARRSLTLSYARQRRRRGGPEDLSPSRFLEELPKDNLDWPGREPGKKPSKATEKARFADLQALLDS